MKRNSIVFTSLSIKKHVTYVSTISFIYLILKESIKMKTW